MAGNQENNRIIWERWQLDYLLSNWEKQTAQQLSDALGITRTKVREKKYELGFYNLQLEFWTVERFGALRSSP